MRNDMHATSLLLVKVYLHAVDAIRCHQWQKGRTMAVTPASTIEAHQHILHPPFRSYLSV